MWERKRKIHATCQVRKKDENTIVQSVKKLLTYIMFE